VLDGARMRMARKPSALARELLKNFPKGKRRRGGRRRRKKGGGGGEGADGASVPETGKQQQQGADETPSKEDGDQQDAPGEEQDAPGEPQDEPDEQRDAA
jgi:ribonuclease E